MEIASRVGAQAGCRDIGALGLEVTDRVFGKLDIAQLVVVYYAAARTDLVSRACIPPSVVDSGA